MNNNYQDIHIADKTLWQQFQTYWKNGNYSSALSLLSNSQLDNKKMIASVFNAITTDLTSLQSNTPGTFKSDRIKVQSTAPTLTSGQVWFQTT